MLPEIFGYFIITNFYNAVIILHFIEHVQRLKKKPTLIYTKSVS